ncbi:hypothetical protein XM53_16465 [Roseovarius atlanticus]|uniref:Uncharacterized protein n=1 Tax=Roseovarius atlanticus TaxID=1641875 RepID=A0A0T5NRE5_9RHOB|nr:hypothetical protein XM53_16465 [Roseovarius atlanticus]
MCSGLKLLKEMMQYSLQRILQFRVSRLRGVTLNNLKIITKKLYLRRCRSLPGDMHSVLSKANLDQANLI